MLRSVFAKMLHDHWRAVLAWTAFSACWPILYVALYPSIGAAREMERMLEEMPPALRAFFAAEGLDLASPEGYLNVELFSFVAPLLMMAISLTLGGSATAGEEERGTVDLLLANPVRRWRVVVDKAAAIAVATAILGAGLWGGIALGGAIGGVELDMARVAAAVVSAGLLGAALGGVAMLVGALTGRRMQAIAAGAAVGVAAFFVNSLAPLVEELEAWRPLSPFYHYIGNDPLANGLDAVHAGVLLAGAVIAVALAAVAFERRDLRA